MQRTSSLYQAEVQKQFAAQGFVRITFGLTDTDAAATCAAPQTTEGAVYSRPDAMLLEDAAPKTTYATLEPSRMKADGAQRILPKEEAGRLAEGFVSAALCGEDGSFTAEDVPGIVLSFSKAHTVPGLTLTFDPTCGDWPSRMHLKAYRGDQVILDTDYEPNTAIYTTPDPIERFDALELTFSRMTKPFRRMRLQQLMFGYGLVFDIHQITSASQTLDVDPISRRLPTNTLTFEIVNINTLTGGSGGQYLYDPDNAAGIYKYISKRSPLKVEWGQYLSGGMTWKDVYANTWGELELNGWREVYEGGVTEWVPGGRYYLTAQPTVDGLTASFKAQDALSGLDGTYIKGVYAPDWKSLYELAEAVLTDSGLPPFAGDALPWKLWDGLKSICTTAPLPAKKHKELLQLIAHASCCVLYTDREGYIRIEPVSGVQDDFRLDFHTMYDRPRVSQIPTLRAVECLAYTYAPEAQISELHRESYSIDGALTLQLTFPQAVGVAVQVTGAAVTGQKIWAGAVELTLTGSGTAEVVVTGKKLTTSTRTVTVQVDDPDENGSVETLDNPLITDSGRAAAVATWVRDWLLYRNTYEFSYRGNPELDPGDLIWLETQFAPGLAPARVLKSELTYSGGLSGKMTAKRMVKT